MEERRVLFSGEQIQQRVRELAVAISRQHRGQDIVLVGLLKGAFMFLRDLGAVLEQIKTANIADCPGVGKVFVEFLSVSSYNDGHTSGDLKLEMDIRRPVKDAHVVLVEDVADTCNTLAWAYAHLRKKEPASLSVCVLVAKPDKHRHEVTLHHVGFSQTDLPFLGGYGLDVAGADRCVPYIFEVPPE